MVQILDLNFVQLYQNNPNLRKNSYRIKFVEFILQILNTLWYTYYSDLIQNCQWSDAWAILK